jgi:hypothetical protein
MTKMQNFFKFGRIFSVKLQNNPSWTWQQCVKVLASCQLFMKHFSTYIHNKGVRQCCQIAVYTAILLKSSGKGLKQRNFYLM